MEDRPLVVIGGSAGALEAVLAIAASLPSSFPAAVLVVIHYPEDATSSLAGILARSGPFRAEVLRDGTELRDVCLGVAPPGRHAVVAGRRVRLEDGPPVNRLRPSIDVLFESAARALGAACVGVILSGTLDDGARGLAEIVRCGGRAIVQAPDEARYDSMPRSAIREAAGAEILPARDIGPRLLDLVGAAGGAAPLAPPAPAPNSQRTDLRPRADGAPVTDGSEPPATATTAESSNGRASAEAERRRDGRIDALERLESAALRRDAAPLAKTYHRLAGEARAASRRDDGEAERGPEERVVDGEG